jgi:hypothetical protein
MSFHGPLRPRLWPAGAAGFRGYSFRARDEGALQVINSDASIARVVHWAGD